ncbi:MAG: 16S rRNA (guanine(966)-N(2))-methyltransferase RsmD [Bacteroidales bacterium]|nr:16S rRNA (guanine(966)-N(2))-methyltransferase RsmD [Bacteroidales bacterium]
MRIVSGTLKSRRIDTPNNLPVRPTTDMAKEALFNILNNKYYIEDLKVLDLFSGTGNIAYEFYSRESESVTAVEQNSKCIKFIKETKEKFDMDNLQIIQSDCFSFLKSVNSKYHLIFADPPYDMPNYEEIIDLVFTRDLLEEDGILIMEHSKSNNLSKHEYFSEKRRYGGVNFSFFKRI